MEGGGKSVGFGSSPLRPDPKLRRESSSTRSSAAATAEGRLPCSDRGRKELGHEMQKVLFPTGGSQHSSVDFKGTVPVFTT